MTKSCNCLNKKQRKRKGSLFWPEQVGTEIELHEEYAAEVDLEVVTWPCCWKEDGHTEACRRCCFLRGTGAAYLWWVQVGVLCCAVLSKGGEQSGERPKEHSRNEERSWEQDLQRVERTGAAKSRENYRVTHTAMPKWCNEENDVLYAYDGSDEKYYFLIFSKEDEG